MQVSYTGTNSQGETVSDSIIQKADTNSNINLSYTWPWSNLIQGEYQFSVVAFTSEGRGEAANLMVYSNGKLMLEP